MLNHATARQRFAVIAANMHEPGAKLISVNEAFETLTGYSASNSIGQNCRFLQGDGTEPMAVKQLIEGMRAARPVQIEVTNYRSDGAPFRNLISLQPVHDTNGVYRYCIGVLADVASMSPDDRNTYERLCRMLPRVCEDSGSAINPRTSYVAEPISPEVRRSVAKIVFLNDRTYTLLAIARDETLLYRFGCFLGPRQAILDFWNEASEVDTLFDDVEREERAVEVINKFLQGNIPSIARDAIFDFVQTEVPL